MVRAANELGVERLLGEYIPTPKNKMVKDLYAGMGFTPCNDKWELELKNFREFKTFIQVENA